MEILQKSTFLSDPPPTLAFCFAKCSFIFAVLLATEAKLNPLTWTWVKLAVDQTVDVVVCTLYSPGEFYCHVLGEDGKLACLIYSFLQICCHR